MASEDLEEFKRMLQQKPKIIPEERIKYFKVQLQSNKKFKTQAKYYVDTKSSEINRKTLEIFSIYIKDDHTETGKTKSDDEALCISSDIFSDQKLPEEYSGKVMKGMNLWSLYLSKKYKDLKRDQNEPGIRARFLYICVRKIQMAKLAYAFEKIHYSRKISSIIRIFLKKVSIIFRTFRERVLFTSMSRLIENKWEKKFRSLSERYQGKYEKYILKLCYERMMYSLIMKVRITFVTLKSYVPDGMEYETYTETTKITEIIIDERHTYVGPDPAVHNVESSHTGTNTVNLNNRSIAISDISVNQGEEGYEYEYCYEEQTESEGKNENSRIHEPENSGELERKLMPTINLQSDVVIEGGELEDAEREEDERRGAEVKKEAEVKSMNEHSRGREEMEEEEEIENDPSKNFVDVGVNTEEFGEQITYKICIEDEIGGMIEDLRNVDREEEKVQHEDVSEDKEKLEITSERENKAFPQKLELPIDYPLPENKDDLNTIEKYENEPFLKFGDEKITKDLSSPSEKSLNIEILSEPASIINNPEAIQVLEIYSETKENSDTIVQREDESFGDKAEVDNNDSVSNMSSQSDKMVLLKYIFVRKTIRQTASLKPYFYKFKNSGSRVGSKRVSILPEAIDKHSAKQLKRAFKIFYLSFQREFNEWKSKVDYSKKKSWKIEVLAKSLIHLFNARYMILFQIHRSYFREINILKGWIKIVSNQIKLKQKTAINTWKFPIVFERRLKKFEIEYDPNEIDIDNFDIANNLFQQVQELKNSLEPNNSVLCKNKENYLCNATLSFTLIQIMLKDIRRRTSGLMHIAFKKFKLNATVFSFVMKSKLFRKIEINYKYLLKNSFNSLSSTTKKLGKVMQKKQSKSLRSGKMRQTKTQRVTSIFYKFFGKILDKWKLETKIYVDQKKKKYENSLSKISMILKKRYVAVLKQITKAADLKKRRIASLKFLASTVRKLMQSALLRLKVNLHENSSKTIKLKAALNRANARYVTITRTFLRKMQKTTKKALVAIKNTQESKNLLESTNTKLSSAVIQIMIKNISSKTSDLMSFALKNLKEHKMTSLFIIKSKLFRKIEIHYKSLLKNSFDKLGTKSKKIGKVMQKKQSKILRSGKQRETKTQKVTRIFYKFLGRILDKWKLETKSYTALKKTNSESSLRKIAKILKNRVILVLKQLIKTADLNKRKLSSLKALGSTIRKLIQSAVYRWKVNLNEKVTKVKKLKMVLNRAEARYVALIRTFLKKMQRTARKISTTLKENQDSKKSLAANQTKISSAVIQVMLKVISSKTSDLTSFAFKNFKEHGKPSLFLIKSKLFRRIEIHYKFLLKNSLNKLGATTKKIGKVMQKKKNVTLRSGKQRQTKTQRITAIFYKFLGRILNKWKEETKSYVNLKRKNIESSQLSKRKLSSLNFLAGIARKIMQSAIFRWKLNGKNNIPKTMKLKSAFSRAEIRNAALIRYFFKKIQTNARSTSIALKNKTESAVSLRLTNVKLSSAVVQVVLKSMSKRTNDLKDFAFKQLKQYGMASLFLLKSKLFRRIEIRYKYLLKNNFDKLSITAKKISQTMQKKHSDSLRTGKLRQTKTQRVTRIFYKYFRRILDQWKLKTKSYLNIKKRNSGNSILKLSKILKSRFLCVLKQITKTRDLNNKKLSALKYLCNIARKLMQSAIFSWKVNLSGNISKANKLKSMFNIAGTRYTTLTRMFLNKFQKNAKEISLAIQKKSEKYPNSLARVIDKFMNKRLLKSRFKILFNAYVARHVEINNNLWKMKTSRIKTEQEMDYKRKITKLSSIQSVNNLFTTYQTSLKHFALKQLRELSYKSVNRDKSIPSGLKKLQMAYISNLKRAFDKWNSQTKGVVSNIMMNYSQALSTVVMMFNSYLLKKKSSAMHLWKKVKNDAICDKKYACKQMMILGSNIDGKRNMFLLMRAMNLWKICFDDGGNDPTIKALKQELEVTKLKAQSYYSELKKLKNYNSFLFKKVNK